jgi:hypothetical protein
MNFILYSRIERRRMQMRINGHVITQRDYHDWLERHYGIQTLATMAKYYLVMDAAQKAGCPPDENEIKDELDTSAEINPTLAKEYQIMPWTREDNKEALEYSQALTNLTTQNISASDDEIQAYFNANPGKWDKPDKVFVKAIQCANQTVAEHAKEMMQNVKGDAIMEVQRQLAPNALVVGIDGTMAFLKPVGAPSPNKTINAIAKLQPGQVIVVPNGQTWLVVKMDHIQPGKKVTLQDVKNKVALEIKKQRALPPQEILQKLWDNSDIVTDPESQKQQIERLIFPDRAAANPQQ